jgi:hypothetical protein
MLAEFFEVKMSAQLALQVYARYLKQRQELVVDAIFLGVR